MTGSRTSGFKHTTKIEDALGKLLQALGDVKPQLETVRSDSSLGRILGEDVISPLDVPSYDKSAVDGYALWAEGTFGSSLTNPIELKVTGEIAAGMSPSHRIDRKETVQVATGASVPEGANAVVMVEHTKKIDVDTLHVYSPLAPGENVIKVGEDVKKGSIALRHGIRVEPQDVGMLKAVGVDTVLVAKKPIVGVLSTGEELVSTAREIGLGKTVDVNRPILFNLVIEHGGVPLDLGIVRDRMEDVTHRIMEGLEKCDIVLISAGTSVGKADIVPEAINSLGEPGMLVHGISMRPGLPTGLAVVEGKPVISLPGHPVAAIIGFNVFVLPLIHLVLGTGQDFRTLVRAKLTSRIPSSLGMRTFARVLVKKTVEGYLAELIRTTGSSILSSMTRSNGIVIIPEEKEGIEEDETVEVDLFRPVER